jgi:hypothetical protein
MTYPRTAASVLLITSLTLAPLSSASAQWCGWQCNPLTWPFVAAGTVLAGAAFIITAPFRAFAPFPPYYYGPPPAYYGPPPPYPPAYPPSGGYPRQPGYSASAQTHVACQYYVSPGVCGAR